MPVTKTAKRALRVSGRKQSTNKTTIVALESAIRIAKRDKAPKMVTKATSLADRAAKKHIIHKNKASRIKSSLSKIAKPVKKIKPIKSSKKVSA